MSHCACSRNSSIREETSKCPQEKAQQVYNCENDEQPQVGLAPIDWQYGGMMQPAPPVLMAIIDSIQFNLGDWRVLDDFEMEMLDDGPRKVARQDFIRFVQQRCRQDQCNIVLEALFPKGRLCKVNGLTANTDLNGKVGKIMGIYKDGRVGIKFQDVQNILGVRSQNLKLIAVNGL